jgi:hypothetical protein
MMTNDFIANHFDFGLTANYQVANQLETLLLNSHIIFFRYHIEIWIQFSISLHCIQIEYDKMRTGWQHNIKRTYIFKDMWRWTLIVFFYFLPDHEYRICFHTGIISIIQSTLIENWICISTRWLEKIKWQFNDKVCS